MNVVIRKYNPELDYEGLVEVIATEGEEWEDYISPAKRSRYRQALNESITYVALMENVLCGYSRSVNDSGLFIWVADLLVHKDFRGHSLGHKLLKCIKVDFPGQEIFVLSDVDQYYAKLGLKKEGSIFRIV